MLTAPQLPAGTGRPPKDEAAYVAADANVGPEPAVHGAAHSPAILVQELEAAIASGDAVTAAAASADLVLQQSQPRASLNPLFRRCSSGGRSARTSTAGTEAGGAPPPLASASCSSNPLFAGRSASLDSRTLDSRRPSTVGEEGGGEAEAAPAQTLSSSNPLFRTSSALSATSAQSEGHPAELPRELSSANPLFDPCLCTSGPSSESAEEAAAEAVAQALAAGEAALGAASQVLTRHSITEALASRHAAAAVCLRVELLRKEAAALQAQLAAATAEQALDGPGAAGACSPGSLTQQLEACHADLAAAESALETARAEAAAAEARTAELGTHVEPWQQQALAPAALLAARQSKLLTRLLSCSTGEADALLGHLQHKALDSTDA